MKGKDKLNKTVEPFIGPDWTMTEDGIVRKEAILEETEPQRPWWHSGSHCLAALLWVSAVGMEWALVLGAVEDASMGKVIIIANLVLAFCASALASAPRKKA